MSLPSGLAGLTMTNAAARLREFGPNRLVPRRAGAGVLEFLKMIADPMVLMLLGAAAFYLLLHDRSNALILSIAAIPLLAVDVMLEARAHTALKYRRRWKVGPAARMRSWVVTGMVAASLPLCMTWSPLAALMHMRMIAPADWGVAALIVVAATGWRVIAWRPADASLQG